MPTVHFSLEVDVHETFLIGEDSMDLTDEEIEQRLEEIPDEEVVEEAREIMFSAPGFDGISGDMIDRLEVEEVKK